MKNLDKTVDNSFAFMYNIGENYKNFSGGIIMTYNFLITIGDLILNKCIESLSFRVDTPNDSNARCDDVGKILEITGQIGMGEPTVELFSWSLLPTSDSKAYRSVEILITGQNSQVLRKLTFEKAFVVDYNESYSKGSGAGMFSIFLKQKKDKNDVIEVTGE